MRYFVQVAELRSFSRAALHIRIAQPALSRQVRKLEEELGVELFIRSSRGLRLTTAGEQLLRKAYVVLDQMEEISSSLRAGGERISGTVSIGVPPAAGEMLVPPVLISCDDAYPDLRVDIVEGFSGFLYERILGHELSLAVLHNPVPHRDLDIIPLISENMYLVGPAEPTRLLAPASEVRSLRGVPLILPNRPHSLRVLVETTMVENNMPTNLIRHVDGLVIIRSMLRAGLGYSVLTYGSVHRDVRAGVLSARLLDDPPISWKLCLVQRKDARHREAVGAVIDILLAEVQKLVKNGVWRGLPQLPSDVATAP